MLDKLKGLAGKAKDYLAKGYKLAKNNLEAVALMGGAGAAGGFLFDDRWMVAVCAAGALAYVLVAKKLKDKE